MYFNNFPFSFDTTPTCNSACHCDYVKYSPVCGADGNTYISACHAGCSAIRVDNNTKVIISLNHLYTNQIVS